MLQRTSMSCWKVPLMRSTGKLLAKTHLQTSVGQWRGGEKKNIIMCVWDEQNDGLFYAR